MFLIQIQTRGFVHPDLDLDSHNVVYPDQIRIQSDPTLLVGSGSGLDQDSEKFMLDPDPRCSGFAMNLKKKNATQ